MNALELRLTTLNPGLHSSFVKTKETVSLLLQQYIKNFPSYTDHSIEHTMQVLRLASDLLNSDEIQNLNAEEIYILCMACILHDVGMCVPEDKLDSLISNEDYKSYQLRFKDKSLEVYLRDIHHILSKNFINEEWQLLGIPNEKFAKAIGLVAQGHRKVDLSDFEVYNPRYFAKGGRESVCLPYLACVLRIADELDVTNMRTPNILTKYYIPDNEISKKEFQKHQATMQVNFHRDCVIIEAKCTDHNILAALEEQYEKIQNVISTCQKTIRSISHVDDRSFSLQLTKLEPKFEYVNFDPKGIKYSFDVKNVINAFVGKDLYTNHTAALREAIQNGVDACNYKFASDPKYDRSLTVRVSDDEIIICDNGQGMDEFIIENYFGRLASSYYAQDSIKTEFQAIGQFGIGVFSYFLVADYIEIETKAKGKQALKFRTDQDPNGYFHFFDKYEKAEEGTNLILHLKEEFKGKISFDFLEKFIIDVFPFIEFPINLIDNNRNVEILPSSFELNLDADIVPKMHILEQENSSKLGLLKTHVSNNDFEGSMGIVVPSSQQNFNISLSSLFSSNQFYSRKHSEYSEVQISQKGVFVNKYGYQLAFAIGKINILNKLNISLDRSNFRNTAEVDEIINYFEIDLLNKFFYQHLPSLGIISDKEKAKASIWLVENTIARYYDLTSGVRESLKVNLVFKLSKKTKARYLTFQQISEENIAEILIAEPKAKLPISCSDDLIFHLPSRQSRRYKMLFDNVLNYIIEIREKDGVYITYAAKGNYTAVKKMEDNMEYVTDFYGDFNCVKNDKFVINRLDNRIGAREDYYEYSYITFNLNNVFIKKVSEKIEIIKNNSSYRKIVREILSTAADFISEPQKNRLPKNTVIEKINPLIEKLNENSNLNFSNFSDKDF